MAPFFSLSNFFLLLFFSLSFLLCHSLEFQKPPCNDGDRSSLLQFKKSFVFDEFSCDPSTHYSKLDSWKVPEDCCSWDGVHCDDQTGHVIGLDLSGSCLFGSIKSDSPLFRLVHLKTLNLSVNNFSFSTFPGGIGTLSELKHLNLSMANIFGGIPSQILELSKLVSLDLSQNPLMLHKPSLKDLVEKLTHLSELHLEDVDISSHVPHSLSNLTSLTSLILINCSLQGEFPPAIFQLPNLRVLSLSYNPDLLGYLPEFQLDSPLEILIAKGCGFSGVIPSSIGNLSKLYYLRLSYNNFSGNIPSSLGNLFQLTYLSLSENNFGSGTLPNWLHKLTNLQGLGLANTNSYGPIPASFQNLTQLQELYLWGNKLTGPIPSWLANFTHLTILNLRQNELQGPIPDSIFRLPNIQAVDLFSNNISGSLRYDSFLQSKYLSILDLSWNNLTLVSNKYNNATLPKFQLLGLDGCNLREFPTFLRGQNQLEELMMYNNNIKGYVPNWIFTLESLRFLVLGNNFLTHLEHSLNDHTLPWSKLSQLDLSFNELEGPLPIPPPSIVVYDVSKNKLSGELSPLFCNFTSLCVLDLTTNNLSGNLPPCLANLGKSALVLNLGENRFSGKIPDNFTVGCSLKLMDFNQNKIEGEVPRSLVNCSNLEILNLEKNEMNDVFPSWLGILPLLRILSLKSNMLHGSIGQQPLSKIEFNGLQIIDLSDNNFTGKLPVQYFRKWVAMTSVNNNYLAYMEAYITFDGIKDYIWFARYPYFIRMVNKGTERAYKILKFFVVVDLSNNQFEGEIPEIVGTLKALNSLNLSNNMLTSRIPSSLMNLKDLESLDLSRNALSGKIPPQLAVLTSLSIFNVSHNSLTGPIPQGNQFGTFQNDSFSSNPGLCGVPLSKRCGDNGTLSLPPSEDEDEESALELNWEIVVIGLGSGLVIGVAYGWVMDTRKYELLAKKKFARWRRSRRN